MTNAIESIIEKVESGSREIHGIPTAEEVTLRKRGADIVQQVLADNLFPGGLRVSPLGAGWSHDIDAHVCEWPSEDKLLSVGWLPLDAFFDRLGVPGRGRWVVMENSAALVAVDLHQDPPPGPVNVVLARCHRRREVRLREALELSVLADSGYTVEDSHPLVRAAASIGSWWGSDSLGVHGQASRTAGPIALGSGRVRRALSKLSTPFRRRLTVAICGVDGAGKTTVGAALRDSLGRIGVRVDSVWARPGLHLGAITRVSRLVKRIVGQPAGPGVEVAAQGKGSQLRSRRGVVGWVWSTIVTLAFLFDVYRQHLKSRGIVIYDRHVVDAIATLNALYAGPDLRLQRTMVRWFMPKAVLTVYLEIDAETAAKRKPGDMIGLTAVQSQLESYAREVTRVQPLLVLDGTAGVEENVLEILQALLQGNAALDVAK